METYNVLCGLAFSPKHLLDESHRATNTTVTGPYGAEKKNKNESTYMSIDMLVTRNN